MVNCGKQIVKGNGKASGVDGSTRHSFWGSPIQERCADRGKVEAEAQEGCR